MGFTLAGNLVNSILPAAPQAPSAANQMAKIYAMIAGNDLATSLGYKDTKDLVKNRGIAFLQDELQKKFGPEFEQLQFDSIARTAPEMANLNLQLQQQFQGPMLQTQMNAERSVSPDFYNMRDKLGGMLSDNLGKGLNDQQNAFFGKQLNNMAAAHGMADSPLSWANQAEQLTGLNLQQQQLNEQNAQGFLNSFRLFPTQNIQAQGIGTAGLLSGPSFGDLTSLSSNTDAFNMSMQAKRLSDIASFGGSMMGMFGMGGGGGQSSQVPSYNSYPQSWQGGGVAGDAANVYGGAR